jgi:hypothetical protein
MKYRIVTLDTDGYVRLESEADTLKRAKELAHAFFTEDHDEAARAEVRDSAENCVYDVYK